MNKRPAEPDSHPSSRARRRKNPVWKRIFERYRQLGLLPKIAAWCLLLSPIVAVVGYKVAKPIYRNFKQANALRMGQALASKGDSEGAGLAFRKALRTNPKNPEAWRQVAGFVDGLGSADAVMAWQQVVDLDPEDLEARFHLLDAATRHRKPATIAKVLASLPEEAKSDARYIRMMGLEAFEKGDFEEGISLLEKAKATAPDLADVDFQLEVMKLKGGAPAQQFDSARNLEKLGENEDEQGAKALRELFTHALQVEDLLSARVYADRLGQHPKLTLRDHLVLADFELKVGGTYFPIMIQRLTTLVEKNPGDIPVVMGYLISRGRLSEARTWLKGLPDPVTDSEGYYLGLFELALAQDDSSEALSAMKEGALIPEATAESAEKALALMDGRRGEALSEWNKGLQDSDLSAAGVFHLARLAKAQNWSEAQAMALWKLVGQRPQMTAPWMELMLIESGNRNLNGLYRATAGALRADPENAMLKSNFVIASYLSGKGNPRELLELAEEAYHEGEGNPFFLTSYAVALNNAGEPDRAVEVIEKLPASEAKLPERSLYRATIYTNLTRNDEARKALESAEPALARMLPEETLLYRVTLAKLDGKTLSTEEIQAALKSSQASEEEKAQLAQSLREGKTRRSPETEELIQTLRKSRDDAEEDSAAVLEELRRSRDGRGDSQKSTESLLEGIPVDSGR